MVFHENVGRKMVISFVGHSLVSSYEIVKALVKDQIEKIALENQDVTCYLGGYGDFDEMCASACRELKRDIPFLELVYVSPYMTLGEQEKINDLQKRRLYDFSIYPPLEKVPPKFAILKRNEWMMSNADVVIAYVNHSFGGAYKSLKVAKRKNKKIINICDML